MPQIKTNENAYGVNDLIESVFFCSCGLWCETCNLLIDINNFLVDEKMYFGTIEMQNTHRSMWRTTTFRKQKCVSIVFLYQVK